MCKQGQCEKVVKDGSNDVLICKKCYYCSKCKTNQAVARSVVNENKILYEGVICETCIKEVIKSANERTCEMCGKNPQSGKFGTDNWNFCAECLKGGSGFTSVSCGWCKRIVCWGGKMGVSESYDWKNEIAYQTMKERGDGCCSKDCSIKQEKKLAQENQKKCAYCRTLKKPNELLTIQDQGKEIKICSDCKQRKDKPQEHNKYTCERCHASCWKDKGDQGACYYQKRITHWYTDFRKTVNYFCIDGDYGNSVKKGNSKCAEEFKKEHQQTCSNCNKTEWPDMAKGWMLDYEIHKAFCSPDCHVAYRKLTWEQTDQLTQIETLPPELELSDGNKKDFDWEKEGSKKEILYWRESVKELQRQLAESKKKSPNQRHPNEIPHQARQISYLLRLHQNTQKKSEQAYQTKYGKAELDNLIGSNPPNNSDNKGLGKGMIALIVVGGLCLVVGVIYFLKKGKRGKKNA